MKKCTKCHKEYPETLEYFVRNSACKGGLSTQCKVCNKRYKTQYRKKNKDKIYQYNKKYVEDNAEKVALYQKQYLQENKETRNKRESDRYYSDTQYRMTKTLRGRLYNACKGRGCKQSTLDILGCTIDEFLQYIESQFSDNMNWENYGKWHIDHIRPCCSFDLTDPEQQRKCFHYTNLQPLWAIDNLKKAGTYHQ